MDDQRAVQNCCRALVGLGLGFSPRTCNLSYPCQQKQCRTLKKFELHLDALIAVVVVLILAGGFIVYQRFQYAEAMQDNVDLTWEVETMKVDLQTMAVRLDACANGNDSEGRVEQ